MPPKNIILVGFMGTGKTTVGKRLAQDLGWTFKDTDVMIEAREGMSVAAMFEGKGETYFRDVESLIAREMKSFTNHVFATGGGFVLRPENLAAAREAGLVVLMVASPEEIWHRVKDSRTRPLLQGGDPRARMNALLAEREAAYGAIQTRVVTDGKSPDQIAKEISGLLAGE